MKSFLLYTLKGDGLGLANRLAYEGEKVGVFYAKSKGLGVAIKDRPIILFDMAGAGNMAHRLKLAGLTVIGAGMGKIGSAYLSDKLELDRAYGLELMQTMGIKVPDTHKCSDLDEAAVYAQKNPGPWVIRPDKKGFTLQRFIKGIEISLEIYFQHGRPILAPNSTFETKRSFADDLGGTVKELTSTVWGYREKEPRLYQKTLKKLCAFMAGTDYTGPLNIKCIVSYKDGEPYGLKLYPRWRYNAIYAALECMDLPLGKLLNELAQGSLSSIPWKSGFGGAVDITTSEYPKYIPAKYEDKSLYYGKDPLGKQTSARWAGLVKMGYLRGTSNGL